MIVKTRHAGLDPASRDTGFVESRVWIPASAGMTTYRTAMQ